VSKSTETETDVAALVAASKHVLANAATLRKAYATAATVEELGGFNEYREAARNSGITWHVMAGYVPQTAKKGELSAAETAMRTIVNTLFPERGPAAFEGFRTRLQLAVNASTPVAAKAAAGIMKSVPAQTEGKPSEVKETLSKLPDMTGANAPKTARFVTAINKPKELADLGREFGNLSKTVNRTTSRLWVDLIGDTFYELARDKGYLGSIRNLIWDVCGKAVSAHKEFVGEPAKYRTKGKAAANMRTEADHLSAHVEREVRKYCIDKMQPKALPTVKSADEIRKAKVTTAYNALRNMVLGDDAILTLARFKEMAKVIHAATGITPTDCGKHLTEANLKAIKDREAKEAGRKSNVKAIKETAAKAKTSGEQPTT